ncbi:N-acetylmuramoyl-L-alanine amidase [Prochlorococcus sp. MIT 1300]|uniref:N-acetylmuramoyl-L-alanine amidase n=1 Tax=Prochlorococcus sp. MIT 1300 TaxID=3096218 RepID=UPI002A759564|nr:N-acetylmuramoyl-L-alanine amidase [Prochlorococcus sp. MIT 1300]
MGAFFIGLSTCAFVLPAKGPKPPESKHPLTGSFVNLKAEWIGNIELPRSTSILCLAGHADSQGIDGAGTPGEAVDLFNASPMDSTMRDELYWNLRVCEALVKLGRKKGLNISFYDPKSRQIVDENDPRTNWSVGSKFAQKGGYVFEIHFDAYRHHGYGSGLIPAISRPLNRIDESLARSFGRYPKLFRGGLGGPKRNIGILEVGKLEGVLERSLRNPSSREITLNAIAMRILIAVMEGLPVEEVSSQ